MARKKKPPEHANHERWLVSYADFITLLFAFFVVLFSGAAMDKKKGATMATAIASAFTPFKIFQPTSNAFRAGAMGVNAPPMNPSSDQNPTQSVIRFSNPQFIRDDTDLKERVEAIPMGEVNRSKDIDETYAILLNWIQKSDLTEALSLEKIIGGIKIVGLSVMLFPSASEKLTTGGEALIDRIGYILSELPNYMLVAGFTDDMKVSGNHFSSNLELSQARADYVKNRLIESGKLGKNKILAIGRGEMFPRFPNDTAEHRMMNRRVEITVMKNIGTTDTPKPETEETKQPEDPNNENPEAIAPTTPIN